jgi:hypothetical protein
MRITEELKTLARLTLFNMREKAVTYEIKPLMV